MSMTFTDSTVMNMKLERTAAVNEGNWILNGYVVSAQYSKLCVLSCVICVCVCVYLCACVGSVLTVHSTRCMQHLSLCPNGCVLCAVWKRRSTKLLMFVHKLRFNCFPLNWNAETIPIPFYYTSILNAVHRCRTDWVHGFGNFDIFAFVVQKMLQ